MELWEMTFKQYREHLYNTNKYKSKYDAKPELWKQREQHDLKDWENILIERAKEGAIPSDVLMSFIRIFGEVYLFRTFKGNLRYGIQNFRKPKSIRKDDK